MQELTANAKQKQWLQEQGIKEEVWSALQTSVYPGAEPKSVKLVWDYCKARNLDPLKKPVHIVPMYVKDAKTGNSAMRDVIMPGIYELRITASRTGQFAGIDEPVFGPMNAFSGVNAPEFCKITVYRMIAGQKVSFSHTEYFDECVATKKGGEVNAMWSKRPRGQLAKCAEAGALRKAFPEEFGGIITADEAQDYSESRNTPTSEKSNKSISALEAEILIDEDMEALLEAKAKEVKAEFKKQVQQDEWIDDDAGEIVNG